MDRTVNRRAAILSIAGCACCLGAAFGAHASEKGASGASGGHGAGAAPGHKPHWGYTGEGAPEHWGELSPDFKVCQLGMEQSPIDLNGAVQAKFDTPLTLDYRPVGGKIVNNGHTIQVNTDPGCSCTINGMRYDLIQYHFHHPSEHLLSGKALDMEAHFVHKAANHSIAVIGLFLRPGAENTVLAPVFANMPTSVGPERPLPGAIDLNAAFPASRVYYRYSGSLTTPPCSEVVTWTVFHDAAEASAAQIQQFATLFPNNARPVLGKHRRFLLESGS